MAVGRTAVKTVMASQDPLEVSSFRMARAALSQKWTLVGLQIDGNLPCG